ncbi:nucleoside monophosphate kinase [Candidatus Peregrinibacteria bacterium]|nr:nucleoside monophosphate kinase [Candidatus Peregrinibacteria bacterium]
MDYVLFGIQGSGKGTQGKILAEKLHAAYFETGGELRRLAAENSPLGQKVKSIIDAGHLVPNEVVMEIVEDFIKRAGRTDTATPIIWDGIPRNKEQNASFTSLLQKFNRPYTGIYFELSREEAENRLLKRRICSKCKTVYPANYSKALACEKCGGKLATRADDNADSIRTRLDIFFKETLPIVESWRTADKIFTVNAAPPITEVTKELFSRLSV